MSDSDTKEQAAGECLCMGAGPALSKLLKAFGPPEAAAGHFRQARVEVLKGLRAILDQRIEDLTRGTERKGTKVTVE